MARSLGIEESIDLRPLIDVVGPKKVIAQIGLPRILELVGPKQFLELIGRKQFLEILEQSREPLTPEEIEILKRLVP